MYEATFTPSPVSLEEFFKILLNLQDSTELLVLLKYDAGREKRLSLYSSIPGFSLSNARNPITKGLLGMPDVSKLKFFKACNVK